MGLKDGVGDGISEGPPVCAVLEGIVVGCTDGFALGEAVNRAEGLRDGLGDGISEGRELGVTDEGIQVGYVDWIALGRTVDRIVGP